MAHRLDIIDLGCTRGDRPLFQAIHAELTAGELLHVAGSNGSGKTTLLRALCGLTRPAAGDIRWRGLPIAKLGDEYRRDLAHLGHKDGVQGELTPAENLLADACTRGATDAGAVHGALARLGLAPYAAFPSKILSQGQRRRLALARLLVVKKPLWILDEPYTALDADSCHLVSQLLAEHLTAGGLAVLSSHQNFQIPGAVVKRIDLDEARASAGDRSGLDAAGAAGRLGRYRA